jgi:hypothetical protein
LWSLVDSALPVPRPWRGREYGTLSRAERAAHIGEPGPLSYSTHNGPAPAPAWRSHGNLCTVLKVGEGRPERLAADLAFVLQQR